MRLVLFAAALLVLGCRVSRRGVCAAVPGYLDFDNLPDTNFSCEGKVIGGYYADVETGCQMFHVCTIGQKGEITDIKFLCLNGTVFDQETRVCERVDEVDCSKTEGFYGLNLELYGNTGATYGLEEPEEAEDHEESQSHHSPTQSTSPPTPTSSPPPTSTSPPTTPTTVISTTTPPPPPQLPPSTTPAHPFTPPTTISTISSTLHAFNQKPHTVHFSSTSSPHSVSSSFLTFPSGRDHLFETAPEGSGSHSSDLDHFPPPSSSSSSWPQVNLQSGGGSGIIHQTDSSPFHALKTTPKPVNLFGAGGHSNGHSNHQFIFSTTKSPSHFFSPKSPGGFSVTSHPPVTQFPLKNPGHLIQTNIQPDFYHEQENRNRQSQKNSQSFLGHQSNVQIVPNPIHFQYSSRPTHQHPVFTTPSVKSTVVSSTSSVSSVKTSIKHQDDQHNAQNPPANVNSFAFGINSGLSPTTFIEDKLAHNDTKQTPTPPTSYDEYHERDVALDPFFKDVPRISLKQGRANRKKRQTQENIQPSRGNRRFRNKPNSQTENQQEVTESQSISSSRRQPHRSSINRQNIPQTTSRLNTDVTQEPNSQIPTTEISRRLASRRKSFNPSTSPTSLVKDSAIQESHIQQTRLNDQGNKGQRTNTKLNASEQEYITQTTSELPTTTREPLPETSFTCDGKVVGGYYADPEADCQLFHICVLGRHGKIRDDKFLCGPGTRFDQMSRTCQTKHLVNCNLATSLYHLNLPYQFPQDNEPVPDVTFESHKVSKRATKKGAVHLEHEEDSLPDTNFNCDSKPQEGLYADTETNCRYFHLCQKRKNGRLHLVSTFACPSGTAFNQHEGNCDASEEIDCEIYSQSEHSFSKSKSRSRRNVLQQLSNEAAKYKLPQLVNRPKRDTDEDSAETDFTCEDKSEEGLYADVETNCKNFHLCQKNKKGHLYLVSTFKCPPGTSFNQREANCDVSKEIDCVIYSQPEHEFAKSKSRNRRNIVHEHPSTKAKRELTYLIKRYKRNAGKDARETDFTCEDKSDEGLYADIQTNCKTFHLCQKNNKGNFHLVSTFECPPGTAFNQQEGNCDVSKEIDCAIYSQPAHSFSRSRSRNIRNVLQEPESMQTEFHLSQFVNHRKKRNEDQESTEIYYTDDEIQSAERDDQLDADPENFSSDELHDTTLEDTETERDAINDGKKMHKQERNHGKKKSSLTHLNENSDEISNETRETEITEEEKEFESQSHENSNNDSNEKEDYSNESSSAETNKSLESYESAEENKESRENDETKRKSNVNQKDHAATSVENEQDNVGIEDETIEEGSEDTIDQESPKGESLETDDFLVTKSQEHDEYDDKNENISAEESIEKASVKSQTNSKNKKKIENNEDDKSTFDIEETYGNSTENITNNSSPVSTDNSSEINEKLPVKGTEQNVNLKVNPKEHFNSEINEEYKKETKDSREDESKSSNLKKEKNEEDKSIKSGDTFKSKVNQLLLKLNASVEDIHSVDVNTTNEDYYDYYTDEESLLELEELKEKILSADHSSKTKQDKSSGEANLSEVEQFREEVLEKEVPIPAKHNTKHSDKLPEDEKPQNSGKHEFSEKQKKAGTSTGSVPSINEKVSNSSEQESEISTEADAPERWRIPTEGELMTTTANDKVKKQQSGKPLYKSSSVTPSNIDISVESLSIGDDQYVTSTDYHEVEKTTDMISSDKEDSVTTMLIGVHLAQEGEMTKDQDNEKLPSLPVANSVDTHTYIPNTEMTLTDSIEDEITSTETFMTTFPPDTTTTTAPSTTSNLLHPYKSRPVYRTWRTTTPPPPVVIRPNSSLRNPRPRIRQGASKGTVTTESNAVNIKERARPHKEHTNQVEKQEKPKEENVIKSKYTPRESNKENPVEVTQIPVTEEVSSPSTSVNEQYISPDNGTPLLTSLPDLVSVENKPTTTVIPENLNRKTYSDSKTENSDKTLSYSPEDYRTLENARMTPSSVLPTFSRKKFFIEREDQKVTKPSITTINPPMTTTESEFMTESIPATEVPTEQSYFFTSVEAQTPQSNEEVNKDSRSETFTCSGKELHQYLPDPLDCHLFHYCSPGFHSRQLLDFRFMCDKGTAFSPTTHHCENEDESLCGNLHN